jgi:hypothetical protein
MTCALCIRPAIGRNDERGHANHWSGVCKSIVLSPRCRGEMGRKEHVGSLRAQKVPSQTLWDLADWWNGEEDDGRG